MMKNPQKPPLEIGVLTTKLSIDLYSELEYNKGHDKQ